MRPATDLPTILLPAPADFPAWRNAARALLGAELPPDGVEWRVAGDAQPGLTPAEELPAATAEPPRVSRRFVELAETAIRHRDRERFALLYRLLWRLTHGEPALMDIPTDADLARLDGMTKAVRRDAHKMHAFLRFRKIGTDAGDRFVAWFEPDHHILEAETGFFLRRFAGMRWSILTPEASAHWDGSSLSLGPGGTRADAPAEDAQETLWRAYYAAIFNPARLKPAAMRAEMPVKYWKNLPEAQDIARLMADAPRREAEMLSRGATEPAARRQRVQPAAASRVGMRMAASETDDPSFATPQDLLGSAGDEALRAVGGGAAPALRDETLGALHKDPLRALRETLDPATLPAWAAQATQAVFGEGPIGAALLFIGEQPGDEEDLAGRPLVGPAGRLFNQILAQVGIDRGDAYVTNAVKHFKYTPTGKRRLHQSPDAGDIAHYRPFLQREIALVAPRLVVTLGASALRAVTGKPLTIGRTRGAVMRLDDGQAFFATIHPSYLLRLPDPAARAAEERRFREELVAARAAAA